MKILLIGDRHNSAVPPKSRIDNYYESCLEKDLEIIKIAEDNEVSAIVHAGDFWSDSDRKPKNDFIAEIVNRWTKTSIPLYGIVGNHDLFGANLDSLSVTTAGLLDSLGIFRLIDKDNPVKITDKDGKTLIITGTPYHIGMDKPEHISDYIAEKQDADYHLHLVHGMLTDKSKGKLIRHTLIDDIVSTEADVTFCGHDHVGFGIVKKSGKFFVNTGAIVRLTNDVKEINRAVSVVLADFGPSGITITPIPLKSAKPAKDVLSREEAENKKKIEAFAKDLKEQIENINTSKSKGIINIVETICDEQKITDKLRKKIIDDINSKTVANTKSVVKVSGDKRIKSVVIENFQSHENAVIEFDKSFNIIVGESRQGKSSVLRAIRWVYENKPAGKSLIRTGKDKASVVINLNDGTSIERFISKKENGYRLTLPDGSVQEGNTRMLGTIQEYLGFNNMVIDNMSVPINFSLQGSSWYLIGDGYSPSDRARILGSINNTSNLDALVKEYEKSNTQINTLNKRLIKDAQDIRSEISDIDEEILLKRKIKDLVSNYLALQKLYTLKGEKDRLASLNEIVSKLDNCLDNEFFALHDRIVDAIGMVNKIDELKSSIEKSSVLLNKYSEVILRLPNIDFSELSSVQKKLSSLERLNEIRVNLSSENNRLFKADKLISSLSCPDGDKVKDASQKIDKLTKLYDISRNLDRYGRSLKRTEIFISRSNVVDSAPTILSDISMKAMTVDKCKTINNHLVTESAKRRMWSDKISECDKKMNDIVAEKAEILKENKICPTCFSLVSDEVIEKLLNNGKDVL